MLIPAGFPLYDYVLTTASNVEVVTICIYYFIQGETLSVHSVGDNGVLVLIFLTLKPEVYNTK